MGSYQQDIRRVIKIDWLLEIISWLSSADEMQEKHIKHIKKRLLCELTIYLLLA